MLTVPKGKFWEKPVCEGGGGDQRGRGWGAIKPLLLFRLMLLQPRLSVVGLAQGSKGQEAAERQDLKSTATPRLWL